MLYVNDELKIIKKELSFGSFNYVTIGGEKEKENFKTFIQTPELSTGTIEGMRPDLTIKLSANGRPMIKKSDDDSLYVILSTYNPHILHNEGGDLKVPLQQNVDFVGHAFSEEYEYYDQRIYISTFILKAQEGDAFKAEYIYWDNYYAHKPTVYIVHDMNVYPVRETELEFFYEFFNMKAPFRIMSDHKTGIMTNPEDWKGVASFEKCRRPKESKPKKR